MATPGQLKAIDEWLAVFEGEYQPGVIASAVSHGRTNRLDQLTKVEAQTAIDTFQDKAESRQ